MVAEHCRFVRPRRNGSPESPACCATVAPLKDCRRPMDMSGANAAARQKLGKKGLMRASAAIKMSSDCRNKFAERAAVTYLR
jgi:hypothetical protein